MQKEIDFDINDDYDHLLDCQDLIRKNIGRLKNLLFLNRLVFISLIVLLCIGPIGSLIVNFIQTIFAYFTGFSFCALRNSIKHQNKLVEFINKLIFIKIENESISAREDEVAYAEAREERAGRDDDSFGSVVSF